MSTKKTAFEIRITDIPEGLFLLIKKEAEENDRSITKQVLHVLKNIYKKEYEYHS